MRYLTFFLFFLAIAAQAQTPVKEIPADYGYIVKIGQQVPDFDLTTIDGKTIRMDDLKGKVVMLQ